MTWPLPGLACTGCGQTMGVRMLLQGPRCCMCEARDIATANPAPLPKNPEALRDLAAVGYIPAAVELQRVTGHPPGLLQDDSPELSRWLASRPDARRLEREAAAEIGSVED